MKKYIGSCLDIEASHDSEISKHFEDTNQLSQFLAMCSRLELELAVFHVDWNHYDLKNLKKELDERESDFVAGIYNNYQDGMMYIYDELQDVHYFFV